MTRHVRHLLLAVWLGLVVGYVVGRATAGFLYGPITVEIAEPIDTGEPPPAPTGSVWQT